MSPATRSEPGRYWAGSPAASTLPPAVAGGRVADACRIGGSLGSSRGRRLRSSANTITSPALAQTPPRVVPAPPFRRARPASGAMWFGAPEPRFVGAVRSDRRPPGRREARLEPGPHESDVAVDVVGPQGAGRGSQRGAAGESSRQTARRCARLCAGHVDLPFRYPSGRGCTSDLLENLRLPWRLFVPGSLEAAAELPAVQRDVGVGLRDGPARAGPNSADVHPPAGRGWSARPAI